ncbi:DUF2520 domain-containing protein [Aquimarina sp. TRL1]|uniref:Rossmann-like and DUF2520 domain-containing protein n=1 Tax=Aquimarina sp. (strain TRL1) TaxID=2736252 RepID=UPI001589F0F0|nr:DUF2520 domain-containing protein [Aquimarina sp. TRL1]QKX07149.1 DUF2520 domain-containing protein [Aquimarina sp. TRL1]
MINVIILGSGKVAKHLYTAFKVIPEVTIRQCYNRKGILLDDAQTQEDITTDLSQLKNADVYILAISDDSIQPVSEQLPFTNRLVVHVSGGKSIDVIDPKNNRGVFYALQTFSHGKEINFEQVPFCIESDNPVDQKLLSSLAGFLSKKVYPISSHKRSIIHVAAVFVNNFTNHLFSIGHDICQEHHIPFEILHGLIEETALKIKEMPPDKAQTGPALRNDTKTIEKHLSTLSVASQKEFYSTFTKAIQTKYGKEL